MNKKRKEGVADPNVAMEIAVNKTEVFIKKNSKLLIIVLAAIIAVVGGYFVYKYAYADPQTRKAADAMFVAEQQFIMKDYETALNGDGSNIGFLDVVSKYGSSRHGNIAQHYAGACYLHLGAYDDALTHLNNYKTVGGIPGELINAQNSGMKGDCYSQKGEYDKAASMYEKAVEASTNSFTTAYYLKKAGMTHLELGNKDKAKSAFERINEDFGNIQSDRYEEKMYIDQINDEAKMYIGEIDQL